MVSPERGIAVVTGVGMSVASRYFKVPDPATLVQGDGWDWKMNAAAGTGVDLARNGWRVVMLGRDIKVMDLLCRDQLPQVSVICREVDLRDKAAALKVATEVLALKEETELTVHFVHYGGGSKLTTPLPAGLFCSPWEVPAAALPELVADSSSTCINMLQALKETGCWQDQQVTKVVIITALTALRTKLRHTPDAVQKWALHAVARSIALDLVPEGIFVTEIMPGMTDSGFYDKEDIFQSIIVAARALGYEYTEDTFPVMKAERVGEMVRFALEIPVHMREISGLPYGQYPHLGS